MALIRKINTKAKTEINTGFGINTSDYGGRFVNKNGLPNIEKRGIAYLDRISWYHTLLQLPRWKFLMLLVVFYLGINFVFACIYYALGVENLLGLTATSRLGKFGGAYFFSAQRFTTVGYGHISPQGFLTSAVSALEALAGLLTFAIATGLFYGRFSRPKAFIHFSENALLAPYKNGLAIMMRVAPFKNNNLTEAEAKLTAAVTMEEDGKMVNKFFQMELEFSKINALNLSWTIVHPINEDSPFYNFSREDFLNSRGEFLLFIKAFDDMFSNTVIARTSYTFQELLIGAKFVPMYYKNDAGTKTILDLDKINTHADVDISYAFENHTTAKNITG